MTEIVKKKIHLPVYNEGVIPMEIKPVEYSTSAAESSSTGGGRAERSAAEPVITSSKATMQADANDEQEATPAPEAKPYAGLGGLSQTLQEQRTEKQRRREEAKHNWDQSLAEKSSARMALAERMKPEDTSREQRNLRRLAIGQSLGELLGALAGGIIGLGSSKGRGYVAKMPGLYNKTLERLQALKDNDIQANQKFQGLMGSLQEQNLTDAANMAQERYKEALTDERRVKALQDYTYQQELLSANRSTLNKEQEAGREKLARANAGLRGQLQGDRSEQRLKEQSHAASLKQGSISDDVKHIKMLLLPETSQTISGGPKPTTVTRDRTSYSKQQDAAAEVLASKIAPIRRKYDLSDYSIQELQKAIKAKASLGIDWSDVDESLEKGLTAPQIIDLLK